MLGEKIGMWNENRAHTTNPAYLGERTRAHVRIYRLYIILYILSSFSIRLIYNIFVPIVPIFIND